MQYGYAYQLGERIGGLDPDAKAYILAVEAADGATLESGVKKAYNTFVKGCKSDGIWDAIKASCIMAGARTLSGALVPLRGTAPTNYNFVSGDYNRKTGLVGDGSTKLLDSNRNNNADPRSNFHLSVNATTLQTSGTLGFYIGARLSTTESSFVGRSGVSPNNLLATNRTLSASAGTNLGASTGLIGVTRSALGSFTIRGAQTNLSITATSVAPVSRNIHVFQRNADDTNSPTDARLSFYSIGESLDLALLDSRVSRLVAELAFTINTGLIATPYDIDTLKYINAGYEAGGTLA